MKIKFNNIKLRHTLTGMLAIAGVFSLGSCSKDDGAVKSVDLRYKTADEYTVDAAPSAPITIQVKSTDPWIVYSSHPDLCTISPDQGEPDQIYDVNITYKENTALDDRTDTITIKSDYWIGKEIKITQKGIAYLTLEDDKEFLIGKDENSSKTFKVKSNQKWTAAVTEGSEWMSITSGTPGETDGSVTVTCVANQGEQRHGKISVYDRHGVERATVDCTQDGVQISPEWVLQHTDYSAHRITLHVVSNTEWSVSKDDADMDWYSFSQTSFNGTQDLVINLDENPATALRVAAFTLTTKQVEGVDPVIRKIILKQGNNPVVTHHTFDDPENWTTDKGTVNFANGEMTAITGRVTRDNFAPGYYSFHIKSMTGDAQSVIFFTYGEKEVRWHLNMSTGKTNYSTAPWTPVIDHNKTFDKSKGSYTLGLNLTKSENPEFMKIEWYLDGVLMYSYNSDYQNITFPYGKNAFIFIGSSAGTVVYDWWEYTAPIDWGDE